MDRFESLCKRLSFGIQENLHSNMDRFESVTSGGGNDGDL